MTKMMQIRGAGSKFAAPAGKGLEKREKVRYNK